MRHPNKGSRHLVRSRLVLVPACAIIVLLGHSAIPASPPEQVRQGEAGSGTAGSGTAGSSAGVAGSGTSAAGLDRNNGAVRDGVKKQETRGVVPADGATHSQHEGPHSSGSSSDSSSSSVSSIGASTGTSTTRSSTSGSDSSRGRTSDGDSSRSARVDLASKSDVALSAYVTRAALASGYPGCKVLKFQTTGGEQWTYLQAQQKLSEIDMDKPDREPVQTAVSGIACRKGFSSEPRQCCTQDFFFRAGSTDPDVFNQVFSQHHHSGLFVLFDKLRPRYILDAGANAGYTSAYFKLMFPEATVVAVEPDPSNFAMLQRNTKMFDKVHCLNGGLWGWRANITLTHSTGEWGNVFREGEAGKPGIPAYSVLDIQKLYDIPSFDFIKVDIEGAEGMVFDPRADLRWLEGVKVLTVEAHDDFAKHFGLEGVTGRIDSAFKGSGYVRLVENEHALFVTQQLLPEDAPVVGHTTIPMAL